MAIYNEDKNNSRTCNLIKIQRKNDLHDELFLLARIPFEEMLNLMKTLEFKDKKFQTPTLRSSIPKVMRVFRVLFLIFHHISYLI